MSKQKTPIIIDVDTGTDDAIMVICALQMQDILDIRAFTTVMGNVGLDKTSQNTLNLVSSLNSSIKVSVGANKPLFQNLKEATFHGETGLGDVVLKKSTRDFYHKNSWDTIYEEAVLANGKLQILATAPLTNIAISIQKYPELTELIDKITIMGGGLYGGNMTMTSEFNIYNDPEAAKIVFDSKIPLYMVGLDVTLKPRLPEWVFNKIYQIQTPYAALAADIMRFMCKKEYSIGGDRPHLHDLLALCAVVNSHIITFKKFYMTVECEGKITRGMTVADFHNIKKRPPNVHAAIDIDSDHFWDWFINIFNNK